MASYFVIDGRDGSPTVHKYTKKELLQTLKDGEAYDGCEFFQMEDGEWQIISELTGEDGVLIIRGTDVKPAEKKQVIEWDIE